MFSVAAQVAAISSSRMLPSLEGERPVLAISLRRDARRRVGIGMRNSILCTYFYPWLGLDFGGWEERLGGVVL